MIRKCIATLLVAIVLGLGIPATVSAGPTHPPMIHSMEVCVYGPTHPPMRAVDDVSLVEVEVEHDNYQAQP